MKEISWSMVKQKTLKDIKEGECLKVTGDGTVAFYIAVNPQGLMRDKIEALCSIMDNSRNK